MMQIIPFIRVLLNSVITKTMIVMEQLMMVQVSTPITVIRISMDSVIQLILPKPVQHLQDI